MAVDKMQMFSIVAPLHNMQGILEDLVLNGHVHIHNNTEDNSTDSLTMSFIESKMDKDFELGALSKIKYERTNFKDVYDKLDAIAKSIGMETELNFNIEKGFNYKNAKKG